MALPQLATVLNFEDETDALGGSKTPASHDLTPQINRSTLEKIWSLEFDLTPSSAEPVEPTDEPLNLLQGNRLEELDQRFTPANLTREQALKLINVLTHY